MIEKFQARNKNHFVVVDTGDRECEEKAFIGNKMPEQDYGTRATE